MLEGGNVAAAFNDAPHRVTQVGRLPYQAHAASSPNCAIADDKTESALIISTTLSACDGRYLFAGAVGARGPSLSQRWRTTKLHTLKSFAKDLL